MQTELINSTLERLRHAADTLASAWPALTWHKVSGPGPDRLVLENHGSFNGLVLEPGRDLQLSCHLDLPAELASVPLAGHPLQLTIFSLYPADLHWNDQLVFSEAGVPVAAGPALVQVLPVLQAGDNGELRLHIHVPPNQTTTWFQLRFTTPGLRARFELFDTTWAELTLAQALAASAEEQTLVEQAAGLIPAEPGELDQATLQAIEATLQPLAPRAAGLTVHVIGHSHIDMNWLWTWPDTQAVIRRDFRNVLDLMDAFPELTFTHSQPATYELIRQQEPDLFARVRDYIQQGRWEPATLTWVEGDVNMASGEALARQLLEGVTFSRGELGTQPSTYLAPDTFGHAGNLPQLAVSAGASCYYHHRANPGGPDQWPAYWWEGQDGTRLLAVSTPTYNGEIRARDLVETALHARRHGLADSLHFHGIGDHGGGPARHNLEALRRFQARPLLPAARCSTLKTYGQAVRACGAALPVQHGESSTIFEGCYTTHGDTKHYNRQGEILLGTAETLAALAGQDQATRLRGAWRTVCFNQFHDILDGSAIHETYADQAVDFERVSDETHAVIQSALPVLAGGFPVQSIAVTNPSGWEREDWVSLPSLAGKGAVWLEGNHGHRTAGQYSQEGLGFLARLPAFSTVCYQLRPDLPEALPEPLAAMPVHGVNRRAEPRYLQVETALYQVTVRRDCGIFVSFIDKRTNRQLVAYGMRRASDYSDAARPDLALNVLQLAEEHPHEMTAWHLDEVYAETNLLQGGETQVIEAGPARLVLETRHALRASRIVQRAVFYANLPRVDFLTQVDWQEPGNPQTGVPNLKVAFTARLPECQAWFETPFAATRRPCDGQEVPALRWADVGGPEYGIALLNTGKYGYDALGSRLRLSLVRSAYEPDTIADLGQHTIRYSFLPHLGSWQEAGVVQQAAGFNQPLLAWQVEATAKAATTPLPWRPSLAGSPGVLISAFKTSQDGRGHTIRLYESAGRSGEATLFGLPPGAALWETNIVEDRLHALESHRGGLKLAFRPWQVRTLLVEST
jgi:alpha-mannosidase